MTLVRVCDGLGGLVYQSMAHRSTHLYAARDLLPIEIVYTLQRTNGCQRTSCAIRPVFFPTPVETVSEPPLPGDVRAGETGVHLWARVRGKLLSRKYSSKASAPRSKTFPLNLTFSPKEKGLTASSDTYETGCRSLEEENTALFQMCKQRPWELQLNHRTPSCGA